MIIIIRTVLGILIGYGSTVSPSILLEKLSKNSRSLYMTIIICAPTFGEVIICMLIFFIMPEFQAEKIPIIYISLTIILAFNCLVTILYCEDSPRNMLINGNYKEAFKIL